MDLLSAAEHAEIRAALQDVCDTFNKTQLTYHLAGVSVDDTMEDFNDKSYTDYSVKAYVEYPKDTVEQTQEGAYDNCDVFVQFGLDDLDLVGLINSENMPIFAPEHDYMTINGERFRVTFSGVEGAIEQRNILVIVKGMRDKLIS